MRRTTTIDTNTASQSTNYTMTSKLKTLILPQLVERRRQSADSQQTTITSLEGVDGTSIFLVDNASLSDITSPATPTFSHRSGLGHLRCSSSTSSLDLPVPLTLPVYAPECPVPTTSPTSVAPSHSSTLLGPKRLADVQEEGPERDDGENGNEEQDEYDDRDVEYAEDVGQEYRNSYLYGCLCDTPCTHGQSQDHTPSPWPVLQGFDHETGYPADHEIPADQLSPLAVRPFRTDSGSSAIMVDGLAAPDSSFSGLTLRFGSRIHALSRWRSNSARNQRNNFVNLIGAPASEPSLSRAPSSRRSSLSASRRNARNGNSVDEQARFPPPLSVASQAPSFYGSTESVAYIQAPAVRKPSQSSMVSNGMSSPTGVGSTALSGLMIDNNDGRHDDADDDDDDDDENDLRRSLERERSLATTPLLPPLFVSSPPPPVVSPLPPSMQTSPLQSPGIESPLPSGEVNTDGFPMPSEPLPSPLAMSRLSSQDVLPSPPLQKKASTSSLFHPHGHTSVSSMGAAKATPAAAAPQPTLEPHDEWSDRLGHANYTIVPKPPVVAQPSPSTSTDAADAKAKLRQLRADWSQARINYTKHLVRVGEHYGTTSTTYALTDAKWAETEREWKAAHDALREQVLAAQKRAAAAAEGSDAAAAKPAVEDDAISIFPPRHDVSLMVPQLIDGEGKFPHRGDEDIVGPMDRASFMVIPQNGPNGGSNAGATGGPAGKDGGRLGDEKRKMARFWKSLAGRVRLSRK